MIVNPELFVIPNKENFILYLPLENRTALEVTPGVLTILKNASSINGQDSSDGLLGKLKDKKVLVDDNYKVKEFKKNTYSYNPTRVVLLPTTDCNLKCIYCYASSGENKVNMSFEKAKASIDFIAQNALKTGQKKIGISFHGGGEPFMNYNLIQDAVDYTEQVCKDKSLKSNYSVVTNAVLNKEQLNFLADNRFRVNISLDGPEDIQNFQRPMKDGKSSYEHVMKTIKFMEENKQNYGIRSTITNYNLGRLPEMIDFFKENTSLKDVHFEPVFECGRCEKTQTKEPDSKEFLEKIVEAKDYAETKGIEIYYSGGRFDSTTDHFCGAAGSNFILTPYGDITTCLEVSSPNDPRRERFYIGQQNNGGFEINQDKIDYLKSRTVNKITHCTDCFSKYNCAGDCLAKILSRGSLFDTSNNTRCEINRGVLLHEINKKLEENLNK
jgi:uncharacterized protein